MGKIMKKVSSHRLPGFSRSGTSQSLTEIKILKWFGILIIFLIMIQIMITYNYLQNFASNYNENKAVPAYESLDMLNHQNQGIENTKVALANGISGQKKETQVENQNGKDTHDYLTSISNLEDEEAIESNVSQLFEKSEDGKEDIPLDINLPNNDDHTNMMEEENEVKLDDYDSISKNTMQQNNKTLIFLESEMKEHDSIESNEISNKNDFHEAPVVSKIAPNASSIIDAFSDRSNKNNELKQGREDTKTVLQERSLEKKTTLQKKLLDEENAKLQKYREKKMQQSYSQNDSIEQADMKTISCDAKDAFEGIPIDGLGETHSLWTPPTDASLDSKQTWSNEYMKVMSRIREFDAGGEELRTYAKSEIENLKLVRHRLFCSGMKNIVNDDIFI